MVYTSSFILFLLLNIFLSAFENDKDVNEDDVSCDSKVINYLQLSLGFHQRILLM